MIRTNQSFQLRTLSTELLELQSYKRILAERLYNQNTITAVIGNKEQYQNKRSWGEAPELGTSVGFG